MAFLKLFFQWMLSFLKLKLTYLCYRIYFGTRNMLFCRCSIKITNKQENDVKYQIKVSYKLLSKTNVPVLQINLKH